MALLLAALLAAAPLHAENVVRAVGARVAGDAKRTRFVADLTRPASFSAYVVADPYRVILDLPAVSFELPPGAGTKGRGLVQAYRFGALEKGKSRIIMDVPGPVLIEKAFIIPAENGQPARMVVDVVKTDKATFAKMIRRESETARAKVITLPKPGPRTIVIDPGHGGADPGAIGLNGKAEKDLTLAFAKVLKQRLEARGNWRVLLTRDADDFIRLEDRVAIARAAQADLFLALHADMLPGHEGVRGATVYTLSETASDQEAAALASSENSADALGNPALSESGTDVNSVLIGLAQADTANRSAAFARKLVAELGKSTQLGPQPLRSAGFRVLTAPDVPSVLVELGFLSDGTDSDLLESPAWRARTAEAMVRAINAHLDGAQLAKQ